MRFICEGEEVKIRDLEHLTELNTVQLYKLGLDIGFNNKGIIGDHEYLILSDKLTHQKKPSNAQRIHITNKVFSKTCASGRKRLFFIDGKEYTIENILDRFKICRSSFNTYFTGVESLTIDGVDVVVRQACYETEREYTVSKDGIETKNITVKEAMELMGVKKAQILKIVNTGKYTTKGWKVSTKSKGEKSKGENK